MNATVIQGNAAHMSGPNGPITRVVIHATVSPCQPGGARQNALYFQSSQAGGLAHYVVDPGEIVQCCPEDTACWHAPPNHGSIGVELCDPQVDEHGRPLPPERWSDPEHTAMLELAAGLVRDLCQRHGVPMVFVDGPALLAGEHGITTHHEVVQAWHQSDHTDPGPGFPMGQFIALVNNAGSPAPTEEPVTDAEIEKVAQRAAAVAAALIRKDLAVLLHGTTDGSHPANLDNIWKAVNK